MLEYLCRNHSYGVTIIREMERLMNKVMEGWQEMESNQKVACENGVPVGRAIDSSYVDKIRFT